MDHAFQEFVSDPRLRKALEGLKRSNDIFDIITPTENQHSEILKWLFDPREGHGQGDAILKDFLTAAYGSAYENVLCNKDFFCDWPPSRIARTGFHSMISMREYVLPGGGRLDLLMTDPVNRILIVVENKYGAKLGPTQLETYYGEVSRLRARPAFKGYKTAHIVLDRNYGGAKDEDENRISPRNRWAFLDYQWLEAGADRAAVQNKRGNQSAGLVIAYCQKQSGYVPPEQEELDDILADIAMDHRSVVESLGSALAADVIDITEGELSGDFGEKWIFAQHYPDLVERLGSKAKLTFIERQFKTNLPDRDFLVEFGKRDFWLFNRTWHYLMNDKDGKWPVYIEASENRDSVDGASTFAIGVIYRPLNVGEECKARLQEALENEFSELKKGKQNAAYRMLGKKEHLSESNVAARAQALYSRLEKALTPVFAEME